MEASMLLTVTVAALTTMQPPSTAMKPANADNNETAQTTTQPPKIAYIYGEAQLVLSSLR